ncbi:superoxide dismutase [Oscillospiraceae bacterium PP1C4]
MNEHYPFQLAPLPYAYDALEPYIDTLTVSIHHDKHQATYVKNLNKALENYPAYQCWSLEQLICDCPQLPCDIQTAVQRNAGGVYTHELYFDGMTAPCMKKDARPTGRLSEAINRCFNSFEAFQTLMTQTALEQFGSGWAWLASDSCGNLHVLSTSNQDVPLCKGLRPIIVVDVWEHAYYLKYKNMRADYLAAWWNLVDWEFAEESFVQ